MSVWHDQVIFENESNDSTLWVQEKYISLRREAQMIIKRFFWRFCVFA